VPLRHLLPYTMLVLLLCSSLAELVPHDHAHEGEHVCTRVDGAFYFIEALAHDEHDDDHLVGYRLGEEHEHELCGLCLPHAKVPIQVAGSRSRTEVDDDVTLPRAPYNDRVHLTTRPSRGPPTYL